MTLDPLRNEAFAPVVCSRIGAACLVLVLALSACGGDDGAGPEPEPEPEPVPTTLQLTPATVELAITGTQQLTATVLDEDGEPMTTLPQGFQIAWSSSDTTRITVDETGLATGVRPGTATLSAAAGSLRDEASGTVVAPSLQLEAARAVTGQLGVSGGSIEAESGAGVRFRLEVPPGALSEATDVTVTPVASIGHSPFKSVLGAVRFAPDGLRLLQPATLHIELPSAAPATGVAGVRLSDDGAGFGYTVPTREAANVITVAVPHFSGAGGVTIDPEEEPLPTNSDSETDALSAVGLELLSAQEEDRDANISVIATALIEWYNEEIKPGLQAAVQSGDNFVEAISAWRYWWYMTGEAIPAWEIVDQDALADAVRAQLEEALDLAAAAFDAEIFRRNLKCVAEQGGTAPLSIFFLQWVAEGHALHFITDRLTRETVLRELCIQVVYESVELPAQVYQGEPADLRIRVGVSFGPGSFVTSGWPLKVEVQSVGAIEGLLNLTPQEGEASTPLTPTGGPGDAFGAVLTTWIDEENPLPEALGYADVRAERSISRTVAERPLDIDGTWTLVVDGVCSGQITVTQAGAAFSVSGSIGGGVCPFTASGSGTGTLDGSQITFGFASGGGAGGFGSVTFTGTVSANSMSGTYTGDFRAGSWQAFRN